MKLNAGHTKLIGSRAVASASLVTLFACGVSAAKAQVVNYGTYIITSVHSGLAIDDPDYSNTDGEDMQQYAVNNGTNQQWVLTSVGTNQYTLTNASSGQFLDDLGGSRSNSVPIGQNPANGNSSQTWNLIHLSGNTYELTNAESGLALDVDGGGTANGEAIDQYPYQGNPWQQWIFTPAPVPGNEINYGCIGACLTDGEAEGYDGPPPTQGAPGTTTFQLTAIASGNWNSAGVHTIGNYQIGHSTQLPNQQVSYFEFNFSSIQGRTVQAAFVLIPGSTDYDIGVKYPTRCNPPTPSTGPCFKVGVRPLNGRGYSVSQVVDASSNYNSALAAALIGNQNEDLGYAWVENGLHLGTEFGAWTYNFAGLQDEVNSGGDQVLLAADDYDTGESNLSGGGACPACPGGYENYIWGSTGYNTGIIALITVQGGEASLPVVPDGTYEVKNLNSGGALEVADKKEVGEYLDEAAYRGDSKQMWKVTRLADGNYTIRNVSTDKLLEACAEWNIIPATDGNYTLKSVKTGLMLDVSKGSSLMGMGIAQMPAKPGFANQQWSFKPSKINLQASLTAKESATVPCNSL